MVSNVADASRARRAVSSPTGEGPTIEAGALNTFDSNLKSLTDRIDGIIALLNKNYSEITRNTSDEIGAINAELQAMAYGVADGSLKLTRLQGDKLISAQYLMLEVYSRLQKK